MRRPVGPAASIWHVEEQPSPSRRLPSSQVSPGSMWRLPHTGGQSLSCQAAPSRGQQPSPSTKVVMGAWAHAAAQVPAPWRMSVVQVIWSSQPVGHAPGCPGASAMSQVSGGVTTPSPQRGPAGASAPPPGRASTAPPPTRQDVVAPT